MVEHDRRTRDAAIAIRTTDLTKRYREVTAVDSLDLAIAEGEIYGFLGRNGAGKTTTIRMMLGLVRPTRGTVSVFGNDVFRRRRQSVAQIGSLVETATSYPNLTVGENLEIERTLRRAPKESLDRAIALLGLEGLRKRRAGRLSLGNKQRLALARAVLARPRILVLDEPANALDPAGIVEIRRMLRHVADEDGVTVFVSSHILGEVAQLAEAVRRSTADRNRGVKPGVGTEDAGNDAERCRGRRQRIGRAPRYRSGSRSGGDREGPRGIGTLAHEASAGARRPREQIPQTDRR